MKNKYLVTVYEEVSTIYVVEAEHEDEASDKALMGEYDDIDEVVSENNEVISVKEYE